MAQYNANNIYSDVQFTRYSKTDGARTLVIDLINVPMGYSISNAAESCDKIAQTGKTIGGYQGGWNLFPRLYKTRKGAEKALLKNGWVLA